MRPDTLQGYIYVGNNPIRYVDPSGHCPPSVCQDKWVSQDFVDLYYPDLEYQQLHEQWLRVESYNTEVTYQEFLTGREVVNQLVHDPSLYIYYLEAQYSDDDISYLMGCATIYAEYALGKHLEHLVLGVTDISLASELFGAGDTLELLGGPGLAAAFFSFRKGSHNLAKAAAKRGDLLLPGLFKYTPSITAQCC